MRAKNEIFDPKIILVAMVMNWQKHEVTFGTIDLNPLVCPRSLIGNLCKIFDHCF